MRRRATYLSSSSVDLVPYSAYSFKKINPSYSGAAIRVRRSSDSTELDIGFSGTELDTTALLNFVGAGDGFISIWSDQYGVSNFTQPTTDNQPLIVKDGAIIMSNGKISLHHDTIHKWMTVQTPSADLIKADFSVISNTYTSICLTATNNGNIFYGAAVSGNTSTIYDNQIGSPTYYINNVFHTKVNRGAFWSAISGGDVKLISIVGLAPSNGAVSFYSTRYNTGFRAIQYVQEKVFYSEVLTDEQRQAIESDINARNSIY